MRIESWHIHTLEADDSYVAGFGAGPDGFLYVLECLGPKDDSWTDRKVKSDWRVRCIGQDGSESVYIIRDRARNYNLIQPLPDGLLLAGSRCKFFGADTAPNAEVFDFNGRLLRRILLGDGIEKIHSTAGGDVWVGYFDEGVFGNFGWNSPIGSPGLLRFDSDGTQVYRFEPQLGLDSIVDCYALNAISASEAWCYYYTDFSIVRIFDDRVFQHWACPIRGARQIAIWRDAVAMPSGYRAANWTLLRLEKDGKVEIAAELEFVNNSGALLHPLAATCRGDAIWFLQDGGIYRSALRDVKL